MPKWTEKKISSFGGTSRLYFRLGSIVFNLPMGVPRDIEAKWIHRSGKENKKCR